MTEKTNGSELNDGDAVQAGAGAPAGRLSIDREFHDLLYPLPDPGRTADDNIQGREEKRRQEWVARLRDRCQMVSAGLKKAGCVEPFEVWSTDGKLILIDGRDEEYQAALHLGLPITTIEHTFGDREHAESYLISTVLLNKAKPNYTTYYRIVLATRCRHIIAFQEAAKGQQGKRTDLLAHAPECRPLNTRREVAALADCGETQVGQARRMEREGELYFEKQRWIDLRNALIVGDISIGMAYKKFKAAVTDVEERANTAPDCPDESAPGGNGKGHSNGRGSHSRGPKSSTKVKPELVDLKFENPDLKERNENVVYCGDAATVMGLLPDAHAGLVCGSPHYNVDCPYEGQDFRKPHDKYLNEDLAPVVVQAARVLRPGGRLILNVADTFRTTTKEDKRSGIEVPVHADVINLVLGMNKGFLYRGTKIWLKFVKPKRAPLGDAGSPKNPLNYSNYEYILVFSLGDENLAPPGPDTPTGLTKDLYHQWSIGCWYIAPVSTNKADHPCPYPEPLMERVIRLYSWPGDLVLDPWVGTGTTTAVAAKLNRRWFGIDIIDKYARMAHARTIESYQKWQKLAKRIREQGAESRNPVAEALEHFSEEEDSVGTGPDILDDGTEGDHE